jgi:hypothetical protein
MNNDPDRRCKENIRLSCDCPNKDKYKAHHGNRDEWVDQCRCGDIEWVMNLELITKDQEKEDEKKEKITVGKRRKMFTPIDRGELCFSTKRKDILIDGENMKIRKSHLMR